MKKYVFYFVLVFFLCGCASSGIHSAKVGGEASNPFHYSKLKNATPNKSIYSQKLQKYPVGSYSPDALEDLKKNKTNTLDQREIIHLRLAQIGYFNPVLAHELGKVEEFQENLDASKVTILDKFFTFYQSNTEAVDSIFDKTQKYGKPNIRKYDSGLQAILWMLEDGRDEELTKLVKKGDVEELVENAWNFLAADLGTFLDMKRNDMEIIVKYLNEKSGAYISSGQQVSNTIYSRAILNYFFNQPNLFQNEHINKINHAIVNSKNNNRWALKRAAYRLNDPRYIKIWLNPNNVKYERDISNYNQSPSETYNNRNKRKCDCEDIAILSVFLSDLNGFLGRVLVNIWQKIPKVDGHAVGAIKLDIPTENLELGKIYIVGNTRKPSTTLKKPYESFQAAVEAIKPLAGGDKYILTWKKAIYKTYSN